MNTTQVDRNGIVLGLHKSELMQTEADGWGYFNLGPGFSNDYGCEQFR